MTRISKDDVRYYAEKAFVGLAFIGLFLGAVVVGLLIAGALAIPTAWGVMILCGIIHADIFPAVPALSFWDAYVFTWAMMFVRSLLFGEIKVQKG